MHILFWCTYVCLFFIYIYMHTQVLVLYWTPTACIPAMDPMHICILYCTYVYYMCKYICTYVYYICTYVYYICTYVYYIAHMYIIFASTYAHMYIIFPCTYVYYISKYIFVFIVHVHLYIHTGACVTARAFQQWILWEVGGWGWVPFSRNFMSPTPRRKWYLTTGRRAH